MKSVSNPRGGHSAPLIGTYRAVIGGQSVLVKRFAYVPPSEEDEAEAAAAFPEVEELPDGRVGDELRPWRVDPSFFDQDIPDDPQGEAASDVTRDNAEHQLAELLGAEPRPAAVPRNGDGA